MWWINSIIYCSHVGISTLRFILQHLVIYCRSEQCRHFELKWLFFKLLIEFPAKCQFRKNRVVPRVNFRRLSYDLPWTISTRCNISKFKRCSWWIKEMSIRTFLEDNVWVNNRFTQFYEYKPRISKTCENEQKNWNETSKVKNTQVKVASIYFTAALKYPWYLKKKLITL